MAFGIFIPNAPSSMNSFAIIVPSMPFLKDQHLAKYQRALWMNVLCAPRNPSKSAPLVFVWMRYTWLELWTMIAPLCMRISASCKPSLLLGLYQRPGINQHIIRPHLLLRSHARAEARQVYQSRMFDPSLAGRSPSNISACLSRSDLHPWQIQWHSWAYS